MSNLVCVIGASGFIGKHTVKCLEQKGVPVLGVDTLGVSGVRCNIHVRSEVNSLFEKYNPTHLLNLAWCAGIDYANNPENIRWVNSGIQLVNSFYEAGGQRFIGVGSCFEYQHINQQLCSEINTPTRPATLYGKAKLALGTYLEAYAAMKDLSWAWCRPFYITGPGEKNHRLIPNAYHTLMRQEDFTVKTHNILDYMDVRDVARALTAILFSTYNGIVNVGTGQGFSTLFLVKELQGIIGNAGKVLSAEKESSGVCIVADTSILNSYIGFDPKYTLRQALSAYCNQI